MKVWTKAQQTHFADGGVFDKIYEPGFVGRCRHMSARTLPGFRPALSFTLLYLGFMVLIPLAGLFLKTAELTWAQSWHIVSGPRAVASYELTLGTSATAAGINAVFGLLVAWVLVRYPFPGHRIVDAIVDLPLALPTAVAGIALTALYAGNGWLGAPLERAGSQGRVHAARHHGRAHLHRPAVRRPHRAARPPGSRA